MAKLNDWLSINTTSGTGNGYITLTASQSTEPTERSTSLSVKTQSKEVIMTVKQNAFVNSFKAYTNLISSEWEGGTKTTNIITNTTWKAITPDWITVSGSGSGLVSISITFSPNILEEPRTGVIRFLNPSDVEIGTIAVAQSSHIEVNNVIYYTSTDGYRVSPYSSAGIITHTYNDGVGAIYYGEELTTIPNNLFRSRTTLQSVSVPPSVTTVDNAAFFSCSNLVSCDMPSITTINEDAFHHCSSITDEGIASIFKEGLISIGDYAFYGCNSILKLTLPNSLTSLGVYAFQSCQKLKELSIGSGLTVIDRYTFSSCVSLTNVVIPDNITHINESAFDGCTSMGSLTLGSGMYYYGKNAFRNCGLSYVVLSEKTVRDYSYDSSFFYNNSNLTSVYAPNLFTWLCYPTKIFTYNSNVRNLYVNNEILTEVVIPEGMEIVNEYAFYKNPNITSVIISDWVTNVQPYAFGGVNNANFLYVGNSVTNIGNYGFSEFEGILVIDNTKTVVSTGDNYFKKVIIHNISSSGIITNNTVEEIDIENDNIYLRNYYNNNGFTNVKTLTINGKNFGLGHYLFKGNLYLWKLEDENIIEIGEYAFADSQITSIKCDNLELIDNYAFKNCNNLSSVSFTKDIKIFSDAFYNCPLITEFDFSKVSYIGDRAFYGTNITEVLEYGGTYIGDYAFQNTPLTYAELYENGMSLRSRIFEGAKLKQIKMLTPIIEGKDEKLYASIGSNTVFNTKVKTHRNLEIDFWWKNNTSHSGDGWYNILGAGSADGDLTCFELRYYSDSSNTLQFRVGSSSWIFDFSAVRWHHFVINNKGLWLNDEKKISFDDYPSFTVGEELYINGVGYRFDRNANGDFTTFTIDGVDFIPTENGFINGSTNELLESVGSRHNYVYEGLVDVTYIPTKPTINNYTFFGVQQYGYLDCQKDIDYSDWLSTSSYYLGYYNWNDFSVSVTELDFDTQDSYDVVVDNGTPMDWSITHLPFWLSASATSGGEGETTITFTKIKDYVSTDNIIITISGFDYKITANCTITRFDFTDITSYEIAIPNATSITDVEWLTEGIETDKITLTREVDVFTNFEEEISIVTADGTHKICVVVDGTKTPMPKADNRIYYTGWASSFSYYYNTNADYVTSGYYGGGVYYFEYDRPILWLTHNFGNKSEMERISLPSSLQYIDDDCLRDCPNLMDVSFGGDEKYIGSYSFHNCPKLTETTFGGEMEVIGSGAFNKLTTANFLGMTPPRTVRGFNGSCIFYAPIGSDYSSISNSVEYTLEGIERNRGNESHWLDGNQVNLFIPETQAKILFYDATTEQCSMISLGYTSKNSSDAYLSFSYTKKEENLTTYYQVRNGSAECMIEAIKVVRTDMPSDYMVFTIRVNTFKNISLGQFYEAYLDENSSVPSCLLSQVVSGVYVQSVGDYEMRFRAMGVCAPPSCLTIKYKDIYGRELYNKYNFVRAEYRMVSGVRPSVTKWYLDGYMTYK